MLAFANHVRAHKRASRSSGSQKESLSLGLFGKLLLLFLTSRNKATLNPSYFGPVGALGFERMLLSSTVATHLEACNASTR